MITEKKLKSNFLTKSTYNSGLLVSVITVSLCFILSNLYWSTGFYISKQLNASYNNTIVSGEYWRLFSTTFVHGDIKHLLSNAFFLFFLMYMASSFYGVFYIFFIGVFAAGLINLLTLFHYGGDISLVGASGLIYYIWGFWMILYFFIQRQLHFINRILRLGAVFLILLVPTQFDPSTSYFAHYIGFFLGVLFGFFYYLFKRSYLLSKENWDYKILNDELTEFDKIALEYNLDNDD